MGDLTDPAFEALTDLAWPLAVREPASLSIIEWRTLALAQAALEGLANIRASASVTGSGDHQADTEGADRP